MKAIENLQEKKKLQKENYNLKIKVDVLENTMKEIITTQRFAENTTFQFNPFIANVQFKCPYCKMQQTMLLKDGLKTKCSNCGVEHIIAVMSRKEVK